MERPKSEIDASSRIGLAVQPCAQGGELGRGVVDQAFGEVFGFGERFGEGVPASEVG